MLKRGIFIALASVILSFSSQKGIYGTYSYSIQYLGSSSFSIFEDCTFQYRFETTDLTGSLVLSEGIWEVVGNNKYFIKTLFDHNSIPMTVVEKATDSDSLIFILSDGVGLFPTEELFIDDNTVYFFKSKQDTIKVSKTILNNNSVFYIRSVVDPGKISPSFSYCIIKTVKYKINNPESDFFEISFPITSSFKCFFDYHRLEEFNDTIEILGGGFYLKGSKHYLGGKSFDYEGNEINENQDIFIHSRKNRRLQKNNN